MGATKTGTCLRNSFLFFYFHNLFSNQLTNMAEVASNPEEVPPNTYVIRPNFQHKFRPVMVKELIHHTLVEELNGMTYNAEEATDLSKKVADSLKAKLKDLEYDRYKFLVQVIVGEQRGEGCKMGARCFWDSDTDNYAQDIFMNDSLFCVAAVFGVFY